MAIRPSNNPYRPYTQGWAAKEAANEREFWEQRRREQAMIDSQERLFASMREDSRPLYAGSPEEIAQAWLSILATPLFVYVLGGHLSILPWWTYIAIPIVIGILSQRIEAFGEALAHFGKALIALFAIAALCQVVPLTSRAALGAILALAMGYSIFFMISNRAEWLDRALGRFAMCWYAGIVLLMFLIVGCEVAAFWHMDSGAIETDAVWTLKVMTGSIYDAALELWAAIRSGWAGS
jgi:hypothetical protein